MTARCVVLAALALTALAVAPAAAQCRQLLVRALLEYGADPNATRGLDQTPLEVAESCSNASVRGSIVRVLREAGAQEP